MTKEELKNKYSAFITEISEILGLGKPVDILKLCATTDLFFQPLEKRIEELEHQLTHRNCVDCSNHSSKLKMRTLELEKENAELKKQLEMSNKVYNDNLDYSHHIEEQLTKAKELLERLLITSCNSDVLNLLPNCSEVLRVRVEAEQFLKNDGCPDCFCEDCTKDCGI